MQVLIMIAGGGLMALGLLVFKVSTGAMHEATAAVLFSGGLIAFALGALIHTVLELRGDLAARDARRKAEAGDLDAAWRKSEA